MKEIDLKHIWKNANKKKKHSYSLQEIHAYRLKKSVNTYKSGYRTIWFDIAYKGISVIALLYLLLFLNYPNQNILSLLLIVTLLLMIVELSFLRKLKLIKDTDSVIEHLKSNLIFLKTTYKKFILLSAISNSLFVLNGFLLYSYFKYNGTLMETPFNDPVMYFFLAAAFCFSFFAQIPNYKHQTNELMAYINDMDDTEEASVIIEKSNRNRKKNIKLYSILILVALLVFILLLVFYNTF